MCTNYGDRKSIVKFIKLGACNYISKPFDNDDLVYTVKYSLELDSIIK
jgi:DNA-binding NtrC family response regulator